MKKLRWTFLVIFALLISISCENRSINQRAGIYIGEAKIKRTKRFVTAGSSTESVIFDGTVPDTFEIEVIDVEERSYRIERSGFSGGLYDIGNPDFEYIFDDDFFWGAGYTYDRKWISRLDLSNPDELTGYMLAEDKFGIENVDSLGNYSWEYYNFEYRISASRKK